ncbi:MAG TPA: GlmU family protein [Cyclobacteriaceae bacterium]|nr:GlmU family protein [Cyclobacteriaceae bacterium]
MNIVVFDEPAIRVDLMPFTLTRPVAAIRVGILTIGEKWEKLFGQSVSFLTQDYLSEKFPLAPGSDNLFINGALCPDEGLFNSIRNLKNGEVLGKDNRVLAVRAASFDFSKEKFSSAEYAGNPTLIDKPWKIFLENAAQIKSDILLITRGRKSSPLEDPYTKVYAPENIFIEEGATIRAAVLNATNGPIYIGKNAEVQEGCLVRGSFALMEGSTLNMGAKIKGDTTIGPHCKVGGEVSNAVIFGYSNKAHDGFLGSSVLGEWCNLGADTNTSNLKNNYDAVKLWNYGKKSFQSTGLTFCGLMMGDHSKAGINTMFNTGTVVGVCANIFGDGYPRNFVPSFAWGGAAGFDTFQLEKSFVTAAKAMERRQQTLTEVDKRILKNVYEGSVAERVWEKK